MSEETSITPDETTTSEFVMPLDPVASSLTQKIPVARQLAVLGVLMLFIFGTACAPYIKSLLHKAVNTSATVEKSIRNTTQENAMQNTKLQALPFSTIKVMAKSAYVWDVANQKVLYKKNETDVLPLASVTKLMTALVAQEILKTKEPITINSVSIKQDGDSGLKEGEVFDRRTLSDLVLMSSSNDGAFALASAAGDALIPNKGADAFVHAMNVRAKEIGLSETNYKNPTGLDISENESGANGSARDMAFLMEYIIQNQPDILSFTTEGTMRIKSVTGEYHDGENTNEYINKIPGLIGSKTGYTRLAGGNLVIAFNVGLDRPIIAVVLGSTQQERFTDILKLVKETQLYVGAEVLQ